jgi:chemotaxis signal transduction protein
VNPTVPGRQGRSYLVFRVDGVEQVIDAEAVREVMQTRNLQVLPTQEGSPVCCSLVTQGTHVPVIRLGRHAGLRPRNRVIVLVKPAVGLLVDSISRLELVPPQHELEGRVRLGGKWRPVLDPSAFARWTAG